MNIAFRVDASYEIGSGHVMRCLALADILREKGAFCRFVSRNHPGNLCELVRQRGFDVVELGGNAGSLCFESNDLEHSYDEWLGVDWKTDAEQTTHALGIGLLDWLVVDHYALDAKWENAVRVSCRKLMVIDDLADRVHACHLLLDQNLGRKSVDYNSLVSLDECEVLIGPGYALLRPEFAAYRQHSLARRVAPEFKQLLITMGGVDKNNITCRVLQSFRECQLHSECHLTVVMGSNAPWIDEVRREAKLMACKTEVLVNVQNMAQLMAESDFVVGAAGSTSWERCVLGLPSMLIVLADNQKLIANALALVGAVLVTAEMKLKDDIKFLVGKLSEDPSMLVSMSVKAAQVCEGVGAKRVADIMWRRFFQ